MVDGNSVGEQKRGRDIGFSPYQLFVWTPCEMCGKLRWVQLHKGVPGSSMCISCSNKSRKGFPSRLYGSSNPSWKGGRHPNSKGYVVVWIAKEDFFYPMSRSHNLVLEHRLVMAKHLGRCLQRWEVIHHKNHIKDDNRIENLQLVSDDRHKQISILEQRIGLLEKRVTTLEAENVVLRKELTRSF